MRGRREESREERRRDQKKKGDELVSTVKESGERERERERIFGIGWRTADVHNQNVRWSNIHCLTQFCIHALLLFVPGVSCL